MPATVAQSLRPVLILGGSAEARVLAQALVGSSRIAATLSFAGLTEAPELPGVARRRGGFGGDDGLARWLTGTGTAAVIDATHPFAATMPDRAARVCARLGLPCLRLLRPGWTAGPRDLWTWLDTPADAARAIAPGATVFLATGSRSLPGFAGLASCRVHARNIGTDLPFSFPRGGWITGRPPFTPADEAALFRRLRIDWLVTKDAGGAEGRAKLDAARDLGLPVAILRRPPAAASGVASVVAALDWLDRL